MEERNPENNLDREMIYPGRDFIMEASTVGTPRENCRVKTGPSRGIHCRKGGK